MREASSRGLLYIDANSISPMTVAQISEVLRQVSVDFVDACIFGLASQLQERGTLYLSGSRASELSDQLGTLLRVKNVGEDARSSLGSQNDCLEHTERLVGAVHRDHAVRPRNAPAR